ncbi:MAG: adenylyltransferase/cytidyltransferase family protein [Chloroflexi bacterium]|nr:adenylyltransferase/cytidyltransferase family protein [Chloroflexota bacterium]
MMNVVLSGSFDDLRFPQVRLLHEASRLGSVHVLLWSDEMIRAAGGTTPQFSQEERRYFLSGLRYVNQVTLMRGDLNRDEVPALADPQLWVVEAAEDNPQKRAFCKKLGLAYRVLNPADLTDFPLDPVVTSPDPTRKKVIVTGCFDWLHSGHVRFFEEVSELGDLYVAVGSDANVELLKGKGHPLFNQDHRRYMVQSIRFVTQALVTTGSGWMDAAPEIARIKPDIYAVNEDGDKPEKRAFCQDNGLEYVVLKRVPKDGLPRRESTALRGF